MPVPSEAVPFVCLASVCWSLQCLISALTQVGGGGLLLRFAGSVPLRGGRGAADRYRCVWGARAVFRPHWVCPRSRVCALPVYTAQAPGCSIWSGPCVACGSFSGTPQKRGLGWACVLCLPCPSSSGSQELDGRTLPWRRAFSPPRSQPQFPSAPVGCVCLVCSGELVSSRDPPGGCQPSRISGSLWLETGGLFAVW